MGKKKEIIGKVAAGALGLTMLCTSNIGAIAYITEASSLEGDRQHIDEAYEEQLELEKRCKELGVDTSYLYTQFEFVQQGSDVKHPYFARLKNNGKEEPIYVTMGEELTARQKKCSIQALDYVFGVVGEFNSNYRYEIVDEISSEMENKITISINSGYDTPNIYPNASAYKGEAGKNSYIYIVNHNTFFHEDYDLTNIIIHELLHVFKYRDVYYYHEGFSENKFYGNSFINVLVGNSWLDVGMITPNDYGVLMSLYGIDLSIEECKEKLKQYESEYYKALAKNYKKTHTIKEIKEVKTEYSFYNLNKEEKIQVNLEDNNKYILRFFDKDEDDKYELISRCSGEYVLNEGILTLKSVEFNEDTPDILNGKNYENYYIGDVSIANNLLGNPILFDTVRSTYSGVAKKIIKHTPLGFATGAGIGLAIGSILNKVLDKFYQRKKRLSQEKEEENSLST